MFTVTGLIDSVPYRVGVHPEPPDESRHGCVMGSSDVVALLTAHEGEQFQQTPTSDPVALSLTDPASVLAALNVLTSVAEVEGDAPAAESVRGNIY